MQLLLILISIFAFSGCQEKLEEGCTEANCAVSEAAQSVNITFTSSHTIELGEYSYFSPDSYATYDNSFTCSIPQSLIDAGFAMTPTCDIYGVPLKTIAGPFLITILDHETAEDKSVWVDINVTGGFGCNGYGNEITIADFPTTGSPDFSFCADSGAYIRDSAIALGISLPGNGCLGTCTSSLAVLETGLLDQSEETILTAGQLAANYVIFDVAYPLSDLTLNLSPDLQAFCLLSLVPCVP